MPEKTKQSSYTVDEEGAVAIDERTQMSGAYEVKIVEAVTDTTVSGSRWVDLRIEIPSRLDNSNNPKQYRLQRMYVTTGDAKGNIKTFQGNRFDSILLLLEAKPVIKKKVALVFEDGTLIEKSVPQFTEILSKSIGAVLQMGYAWRRKPIDGYTKLLLDPVGLERNPETVWIDDYSKDPMLIFMVVCWFISKGENKGYTYSEIKKKVKAPKNVSRAIKKLRTYEFDSEGKPTVSKMSNESMYIYIEKVLKRQLAAAGDTYVPERFEAYEDASVESLEKIPF